MAFVVKAIFASVGLMVILLQASCVLVSGRPYAEIRQWTGHGALSTYQAAIIGLDGKMKFDGRQAYQVEPGQHVLLLATSGPTRPKDATKAVNLVVQACRSYLIAAEHACSSCDEWEPIVHSVRDISGCEVEPADGGKSADTPTGVGT